MTYVRSDIDGQYYFVRDVDDKQNAANLLARLKKDLFYLNNYLFNNLQNQIANNNLSPAYQINKPYIEQLNTNIQNVVIRESSDNTVYTSYTINKGEKIVFCIRSKTISDFIKSGNIHDYNVIMYVALHEISHVACPETGHTQLFKEIFRFITQEAIKINIYHKIDFVNNPKEYCGMTINDSII